MEQSPRKFSITHAVALGALLVLALATRLPAPWQFELINDEMHHLESWRNRYRSGDIYPLFLQRLDASGRLSPQRLELVRSIYHSSSLVQRGLIILVDPQPPLYPTLAELIEFTTRSSLIVLRLPSLLASLAALWLMYRLGVELKDRALGLWLATLPAIAALPQFYAGIGRPYALAQAALIGCIYAFVIEQRRPHPTPARFLVVALLAQGLQWMAWAVVGPLVLLELYRRYSAHPRLGLILCQTWWYVLITLLLLAWMGIQLLNPTIAQQGGRQPLEVVWDHLRIAAPFAHLGTFGDLWINIGAAAFVALAAAGVVCLLVRRQYLCTGGLALIITLGTSIFAILIIGSAMRFMMSYLVVPIILAGIGARWLCRSATTSNAAVAAVLALFAVLSLWLREDQYQRINTYDVPYDQVAAVLRAELKPGETWLVFPANLGNNLYRFGPFPEPVMAVTREEFESLVQQNPQQMILTERKVQDQVPLLREPHRQWNFLDRVVLMRLRK